MTDEKIIRAAAEALLGFTDEMKYDTLDQACAVLAAVEPLIIEGALPDGAKWFPIEGGIMWQGQVYFPADYVLTRNDIAALRADTLRKAADWVDLVAKTILPPDPPWQQVAVSFGYLLRALAKSEDQEGE